MIKNKKKLKYIVIALVCVILGVMLVLGGFSLYGSYRMRQVPALTSEEALAYTTGGKKDAVITVGVIKDGVTSWTVYGEDGAELPRSLHTYEIGSLTKTVTAAMISLAVQEGKLALSDTIDRYLPLPEGRRYPTVESLLTHTSGYKAYYFASPMVMNFFGGRNDFYGIDREAVLKKAGSLNMPAESYPFRYSNFGYAVLEQLLEEIYGEDYQTLANRFVCEELGLPNTKISDGSGDLGHLWDWRETDAYLSAGALTSNIEDMLSYVRLQMEDNAYLSRCQVPLRKIDAASEAYRNMGIHMDEIGMAWIIDRENGIIWHNGGTGHYNCYVGFAPESETAVVVLSNLAPDDRIPATVLGVKLLQSLIP